MTGMIDTLKADLLAMIGDSIVTAAMISAKIGRSERTVYRLIGILRKEGHAIMSEPGAGYMMLKRKPPVEKIVAAAVRQFGLTVSLPPPARHHTLLEPLHRATDIVVLPDDQGFLTNAGRFVGRIEAADIAFQSGQIKGLQWPPYLYSEDLW